MIYKNLLGWSGRRSAWLPRLVIPESEKRPGFRHGLRLARNEAGVLPTLSLRASWAFRHAERKEAAIPQRKLQA